MKELEALKLLFKYVPSKKWADEHRTDEDTNGCDEVYEMHEAFELLKKALTPPTSEEVCRQLSEHYRKKVEYTNDGFRNGFHTENQYIIKYRGNSIILANKEYFAHDYKADTFTLISRFYQGVKE